MFDKARRHKRIKSYEETPAPTANITAPPSVIVSQETEYRPCYVHGCRALFHRWINTANPILPKGVDPSDEKARYFQHRSTTGLVEYADGTMGRVWPQEIRFIDSAQRFKEYDWDQGKQEAANGAER